MKIALFLVFSVLQIADSVLTHKILAKGGVEHNPILRWAFDRIGIISSLVIFKLALLILLFFTLPWIPVWFLVVLCVAYTVIVIHNWKQI